MVNIHKLVVFHLEGNDLARVLRWGSGYSGSDDPMSLLMSVDQADQVSLDR